MGLIGSNFAYSLLVTPDLWPGEEHPVYVFLDHIPLSEVHQIRLSELNLHVGIPFEIAHIESEEERKRPKVYEIEAMNSIMTITESSVSLVQEEDSQINSGENGDRERDRKRLQQATTSEIDNGENTNKSKDTAAGSQLYVEFTYDALEDFYVVVEFYVKVFKSSTTKTL